MALINHFLSVLGAMNYAPDIVILIQKAKRVIQLSYYNTVKPSDMCQIRRRKIMIG
ncbi:MAG: hypothetical protein SOX82_05630 [Eubacteriales bacterium]|nr:hypothetical protein [Eubacteriales bacterium]